MFSVVRLKKYKEHVCVCPLFWLLPSRQLTPLAVQQTWHRVTVKVCVHVYTLICSGTQQETQTLHKRNVQSSHEYGCIRVAENRCAWVPARVRSHALWLRRALMCVIGPAVSCQRRPSQSWAPPVSWTAPAPYLPAGCAVFGSPWLCPAGSPSPFKPNTHKWTHTT